MSYKRERSTLKTDDESEEKEFLDLEALQPIVDLINRNLTPAHHVLKAEAIDESHCNYGIWLTTNTTVSIFWGQNDDTWGAGIVDANGDWLDEGIDTGCQFTASAEETAIAILTESEKWLESAKAA